MQKYVVEFIGTFFLMLSICMAIQSGLGQFIPLVVGAVLIAVIYAGGHISSAHYNPAITFVFFMENKCPPKDVVGYCFAQLIAVILAVLIGTYLSESMEAVNVTQKVLLPIPALIAEFLGTFALSFVIMNVAMAKTLEGNGFYGAAIGLIVVGCAYLFGSISGGAFNPAVAIGMAMMGLLNWADLWIFAIANFSGAFLSILAFRFVNSK